MTTVRRRTIVCRATWVWARRVCYATKVWDQAGVGEILIV